MGRVQAGANPEHQNAPPVIPPEPERPIEEYPPYIVMTPVGNYMWYVLKDFVDAAKAMIPAPEEVVLVIHADHPFDLDEIKSWGVTIRINAEMSVGDKMPPREAEGREICRKHLLYSPKHINYGFMVDTDIIMHPMTYTAMYDVMQREKCLLATNAVMSRNDLRFIHGAGCMLMDRVACSLSKFFRSWYPNPDGYYDGMDGEHTDQRWSNFSSDYVFFAIFDQCQHTLEDVLGKRGRTRGHWVPLEHRWAGVPWRNRSV